MVKTFITKNETVTESQIQASEVKQFTLNHFYESSEVLITFKSDDETTVLNFVRSKHTCKFFRLNAEGQVTKISPAEKLLTLRTFEEHILDHIEGGILNEITSIEFTK